VVIGPDGAGEVPDPNIAGEGDLYPITPQAEFPPLVLRMDRGGEDRDPAILDLHLSDLRELLEIVQLLEMLRLRGRGAPQGVETLPVCREPPGLGRDSTGILFQVLLEETHLLFQKGHLFVHVTPAFLNIGLPDLGLPSSVPSACRLLGLLPERLQGGLERIQSERGQASELCEDPGETQVEQASQEEWPELSVLTEEVEEDVDVSFDDLCHGSPFLVPKNSSPADVRAGGKAVLRWRCQGIAEGEGEADLRHARE